MSCEKARTFHLAGIRVIATVGGRFPEGPTIFKYSGWIHTGMKSESVEIEIRDQGKHKIIAINGEVNLYSVSKLRKDIMKIIDESVSSLVIDMKNLSHMDSSGIALLANLQKQIRSNSGSFYMMNVNDDIKNVLKLAALDKFFNILDSEADLK